VKPLTRKFVPLCALLCATLLSLPARAECKRAALELPVSISGSHAIINTKINHTDARFIFDSGAFFSMMSEASAAEYQLKVGMAPYGLRISGIGGTTTPGLAIVKVFTIANADIPNVEFLVGGSEAGSNTVGILGQNFLEHWNVEYDLAKGMIRLFQDKGCAGSFLAYWAAKESLPYTEMRIEKVTPQKPHTIGSAYVNGEKIRVLFDSGAFVSTLTLRAAERAGIKIDAPGVTEGGLIRGIGGSLVKSYIVPFSSFKFADGEEIKNARLRVADTRLEIADMLLGADFFLSHRVFVANNQDKVYFTYNGGPVFDLKRIDAKLAAQTTEGAEPQVAADNSSSEVAKASASTSASASGTEDAAALARRGTASAGRHDYDGALADLTRAAQLEPANSEYFYERGRVLVAKQQYPQAMADLDRALELKPDYVSALLVRAELRFNAKNISGAIADLQTIDKTAAKQSDVRLDVAHLYERIDQLPAAIAQYDLWLAAHGDDARRFYAYQGLCHGRGIVGQELPAALKACNEAVSLSDKKKNPVALANRALVHLRLGNFDKAIADYDASLRMEPNKAWTLYGRGLARLKANRRPAGEVDIAEAVKVSPSVAGAYKQIGLVP
jgi:tetratricopeptide (TPR) repeat protein/predicted aspartyl protease